MFERQFFINDTYQGSVTEIGQRIGHGAMIPGSPPASLVYICPHCGAAWARVTGHGLWRAVRRSCGSCPPFIEQVPGSLLSDEVVMTDKFPERLIRREAMLHLEYWEKYHDKESEEG